MNSVNAIKTIVIGSLNTDLVATGIERFPSPGEHVYGKELRIGPGGKSRNIADMIAYLAPPNTVAMIGRTVRDPYGLWKLPVDALIKSTVNTDFINVIDYSQSQKLPGIALIPVDENGNNQIFFLPGISSDFSISDIDNATPLFESASQNGGILALTLECPLETAGHAVRKANKLGLKVMFDPGGIEANTNLKTLIESGIFLIKPNEHEAKMLTGIDVNNFDSAKAAAQKLKEQGINNILITAGSNGAYLISDTQQKHIPIPEIKTSGEKDETGCGDQAMAALCASLQEGKSLEEAAELAVLAGTLQFHKIGIQPVERKELFK